MERGAAGIAEIFGITEHLNVTMGADSTRGALHEETVYGERLTPRGRAEKLPILSWVDPDFTAPIRSDELLPLGKCTRLLKQLNIESYLFYAENFERLASFPITKQRFL